MHSCRDQFKYSFSFCLFITQFSGGREDLPVMPQDVCHPGRWLFLCICSVSQVISGYSGRKDMLLDAPLYSALYRGVLKVPTLIRVHHCSGSSSILCQQARLAPFPLLIVVELPLTCTDGKLIAAGRLVRYASSGQQVIWLNMGMEHVPKELLVFPGVELA